MEDEDTTESVAVKCRTFYLERLERTEKLTRRWDSVDKSQEAHPHTGSTLDLAMRSLRKEISTLIHQDNELFQQLLRLNDSIEEMKERSCKVLSRSPSYQSLSDEERCTLSPTSTISSGSSSSSGVASGRQKQKRCGTECTRERQTCVPLAWSKRRAKSHGNLFRPIADFDSFDSGIHLRCSDSDHEIFV